MRARPDPRIQVTGTGSCFPERVIDNRTLEGLVGGYDPGVSGDFARWVDQVTHVHERRYCAPHERTSDFALGAARQALAMAGLGPRDLGMIVYASFTPSHAIPGDHCLLAHELGTGDTPTFNLMAACAGSVYGMAVAYGMLAAGVYEHVLVVGTETISRAINFQDPLTAIIFGDGAGAVILSRKDGPKGTGMLPPYLACRYNARNIHLGNSNIPVDVRAFPESEIQPGVKLVEQALIEMEGGPSVLRHAVNAMAGCTLRCLGYEERELRHATDGLAETLRRAILVPHQANGRIVDGLAEKLGIPPGRVIRTIYRYGNLSAASNLVALDHAMRRGNMVRRLDPTGAVVSVDDDPSGRIVPGDLVLLPSIGGGYLMGCVGFVAHATPG
jgi:3-oxoacyl-[acyl-carrier-protein] synthase-3